MIRVKSFMKLVEEGNKKLIDMDADELDKFLAKYNNQSFKLAKDLFTEKPPNYVKTAKTIIKWAWNRLTYLRHPDSNVPLRDMSRGSYMDIADELYGDLPDYGKEIIQ